MKDCNNMGKVMWGWISEEGVGKSQALWNYTIKFIFLKIYLFIGKSDIYREEERQREALPYNDSLPK